MTKARVQIVFDDGQTHVYDEAEAREFTQLHLDAGYGTATPDIYEIDAAALARLRAAEAEYGAALRAVHESGEMIEVGEWTEADIDARSRRAFNYIIQSWEDEHDDLIGTESDCLDVMERCSLPSDGHFDFEMVKARVYDALESNGFRFTDSGVLAR